MRATAFDLEFPENRENNTEFAIFSCRSDADSFCNSGVFYVIPSRLEQGMFDARAGNFIYRSREFICPSKEYRDYPLLIRQNRPKPWMASKLYKTII
jgi:hypothetical protein